MSKLVPAFDSRPLANGQSPIAVFERRLAVVKEARSCLRTPYLSHARVKGAGLDCATFLELVYANAEVFTARDLPELSPQWFLHADREWYLEYLQRYAGEFSDHAPQPGDIVCARHGRAYSHGAIVTEWPMVIHCFPPCVMETNALYDPAYMGRLMKFFDPWAVTPQLAIGDWQLARESDEGSGALGLSEPMANSQSPTAVLP